MRDFWQRQATAFLQIQQQQPGFSQILLAVISQARIRWPVRLANSFSLPQQAGQSAPDIASSASISLKNLCKKHWANDDSTDFLVCDADKQFLKGSMLAGAWPPHPTCSLPLTPRQACLCAHLKFAPLYLRL